MATPQAVPPTVPADLAAPFDVLVVGAGINGVGIAREAATRGLRVALLERDDIASGVSAWSGRLVHGGLRYLEHRDIALVRESLRERERLFRLAPHLVEPIPVLMPFYATNRRPDWLIRLGMIAYDVLSWDKSTPRHRILSRTQVREQLPGLDPAGLRGAARFYDGQVAYAERLCVEVAVAARQAGAVVRTRANVDEVLRADGAVVGVAFTDTTTGARHEVCAPVVLNVTGPWIDRTFQHNFPPQPRMNGGTKGSHAIVDPFPGAPEEVVYYESKADGRLVLIIPWMGRYLIGCTDLRFDADPGEARADHDEIAYLLGEVNTLIPEAQLTAEDVRYVYSGVRPLPYAPGVPESKVPRSHVLHDHGAGLDGLYTVIGGKLTTFRQLAEDAVDTVLERLGRPPVPSATARLPLPGSHGGDPDAVQARLAALGGFSPAAVTRLVDLYGTRALEIWELAAADPTLHADLTAEAGAAEPTGAATSVAGVTGAEIVYAVEHEFAVGLDDVFARRTLLAFEPGHGLALVEAAAAVLTRRYGWDEARRRAEIARYHDWLDHLALQPALPDPGGAR